MTVRPEQVSTDALAYLGDCIIERCVRRRLVLQGFTRSARLNEEALRYVRAGAQAQAMQRILPVLTEEETAVFRRGRNIGHTNTPKSATVSEYRTATGMEALFGYLELTARQDRIEELFTLAYPLPSEDCATQES